MPSSLLWALGANLTFSISSVVFTEFSAKHTVLWMNAFKASIATLAFFLTVFIFNLWGHPSLATVGVLSLSGFLGLLLGDLFLLSSYTQIGPGRCLMLFGFDPIFLGIMALFLFAQPFPLYKILAVFCMVACLFTLSFEKFKEHGHWHWRGLWHGLLAVFLDACGVLLTKQAFEMSPQMSPVEGNLYRGLGAVFGFAMIGIFVRPIELKKNFLKNSPRQRFKVLIGSIAGCYLCLLMYLTAVRSGHLASVSAIGITSPMFASLFECYQKRTWPSAYLLVGFSFFVLGFMILVVPSPF